jgi:hypothetical protein
VRQLVDAAELVIRWYSASPQGRQEIVRINRRWYFHPAPTDRCLVIGQSPLEIDRRTKALGLVFLAHPSALIFSPAALGIPGSYLVILSLFTSLVSIWMMACFKVRRLNESR